MGHPLNVCQRQQTIWRPFALANDTTKTSPPFDHLLWTNHGSDGRMAIVTVIMPRQNSRRVLNGKENLIYSWTVYLYITPSSIRTSTTIHFRRILEIYQKLLATSRCYSTLARVVAWAVHFDFCVILFASLSMERKPLLSWVTCFASFTVVVV